jgi:hypothetical protein
MLRNVKFALPVTALAALIAVTLVLAPSLSGDSGDTVESADAPTSFEFALWGDEPYGANDIAKMPALIADMNAAKVAFTVFNGDTKDGSSACTNAVIVDAARGYFNATDAPTVYLPGDNEWTDCHRTNNGGWNPLERLDTIRKAFFSTNQSLGKNTMTLDRQGPAGGLYSENVRWVYGNIVFVGLNVPGSNNNKVNAGTCTAANTQRIQAECDADNVEYTLRDAANLAWLRRGFELARGLGSPGIMVIVQADMFFDAPNTPVNERSDTSFRLQNQLDGYNNFIDVLEAETRNFKGQVVLVNGDTHTFLIDKPLPNASSTLMNFTRVQTFGSGRPHWVKAIVDPTSRTVFKFEPMIVPGN